ncbi:MAG: FtsX-like permease family protein [Gemmataceae bacterium]
MAHVFTALKWAFLGGVGFLALTFAAIFLVLFLQSLGVLKKVPFSYSLRNLAVRWPITGLTAMAFTLVVALLVFMLAFVQAMYKLTESSGVPENVLVLSDGATDELFSNLGFGDVKEIELRPEVVRENGKPLASWEVYVVVNQPISVRKCPRCGQLVGVDRYDELVKHGEPACEGSGLSVRGTRGRRFIQVRGIEDPAVSGRVHNLALHDGGTWFSSSSVRALAGSSSGEQAIEAVIGEGLARELGPDLSKKALEVGDLFELGPRRWVVVGILKSAGSTFDSEVWGKFQIVGELFGKSAYTTCVLRAADADAAGELAADLSANYKKPAVVAQPEPKYYASLNTTNEQFLGGVMLLAFIMAIGGAIAVMNTMFAAIAQRTKDIGVLRILGFAPWQVLVSFFLESVLLALVGGLLGCAIGFLANGWTASSVISSGQGGGKSIVLKLIVDGMTLGAGMVFALVMGCLGGLIPSLSAMRLRPLDAVR